MSQHKKPKPRNLTAMVMISSGKGRKQIFKDKRAHRAKDYKNSWQKEWEK